MTSPAREEAIGKTATDSFGRQGRWTDSPVAARISTTARPQPTVPCMSVLPQRPPQFVAGPPYHAFSRFLRERFGTKVYRVTIDAGFTCPNVDGTVTVGGCVYCDNRSFSPNRRLPRSSVREQVRRGIDILGKRYGADRFLAYFQAATNTHAPVDKLQRL